MQISHDTPQQKEGFFSLFLIFLRLGLTSFGGPVAHLGYFRTEFVERRHWFDDKAYTDLVALCQFLPGPASSQVGIGIGLSRGGYLGSLAAWLGFTLPSALLLTLFALGLSYYDNAVTTGALHGLKIVAAAVVAQAVWGMAKSFCTDGLKVTLMAASCSILLIIPGISVQLLILIGAAVIGLLFFKQPQQNQVSPLNIAISNRAALFFLTVFVVLLFGLPLAAQWFPSTTLSAFDSFYRSGSLVFGGGHVVLPLLQTELVNTGMIDKETFLAGYGATQAVPGPLFTFASFIGASLPGEAGGWLGSLVCLLAMFIPSFLLVFAALPFWENLRRHSKVQAALAAVNAAVVGLLLAALYQPVITSAIFNAQDFAFCLIAFVALTQWKQPPWLVVISCALIGGLLSL
ncbi:chromate efflux transporter [Pleionea sp. CnH1-48]|uniref:chromate efflux transporter n=1 Tax=Pleionea sp. CnH1-48 TaxID=2954494 RepID=UPI002098132A|nr:chromate efflux transporter [Pleionea sp. CnH1-48]MCO7224289.1 chromate efflux transporter [Pleionea sp. CnH1-48]